MNHPAVRVRYAPSPTGLQHPGVVRTALFAWLLARHSGGDFILRIEDTDKVREVEGSIEYMYSTLKWLGIEWDEGPDIGGEFGPYQQSQRLDIYRSYAQTLIERGLAYADPYTADELQALRQRAKDESKPFLYRDYRPISPPKWRPGLPLRFRVNELKNYTWHDAVRGKLSAKAEALDDFIILKSDGYPTYNFANVIDDHLMKISHILRGEEYLASIPKYLSLYEALDWNPPVNATMPLVLGKTGGKKLSKRDGALPMLEYKQLGYLPVAVNNFLATLGWNDGTTQEVYEMPELIEKFQLQRLQKAPARFDISRLDYLNGVHIRKLKSQKLLDLAEDYWPQDAESYDREYKLQVLNLVRERLKFLSQLEEYSHFFFSDPDILVVSNLLSTHKMTKALATDETGKILKQTVDNLVSVDFSKAAIETELRKTANQLNLSSGRLFMVLRIVVCGSQVAPGLFETLEVLGKETTLRRLKIISST